MEPRSLQPFPTAAVSRSLTGSGTAPRLRCRRKSPRPRPLYAKGSISPPAKPRDQENARSSIERRQGDLEGAPVFRKVSRDTKWRHSRFSHLWYDLWYESCNLLFFINYLWTPLLHQYYPLTRCLKKKNRFCQYPSGWRKLCRSCQPVRGARPSDMRSAPARCPTGGSKTSTPRLTCRRAR